MAEAARESKEEGYARGGHGIPGLFIQLVEDALKGGFSMYVRSGRSPIGITRA